MDYADWLESVAGSTGGMGEGGDMDMEERRALLMQRVERDAVLCLVDCRAEMFIPPPIAARGRGGKKDEEATAAVKLEGLGVKSSSSAEEAHKTASATAFSQALQCILKLYQEKVITNDKDVLALGFYNTATKHNIYDFPGIYIVQPFGTLGADSVQVVEQLEAAGDPISEAYTDFMERIGHAQPREGSATGKSSCALSDALWAAQHMFLNLRSNTIKYRRVFVFTNDDDPTRGDALEHDRCAARARDLREADVALEVFALCNDDGSISTAPSAAVSTTRTGTTSAESGGSAAAPASIFSSATAAAGFGGGGGSSVPAHVALDPTSTTAAQATTSASTVATKFTFNKSRFWEPLMQDAARYAATGSFSGASSINMNNGGHTAGSGACGSAPGAYGGAVYVNAMHSFQDLLDAVRRKVHPQRPFLNCALTIGMRADGGTVPTIAVSVYTPLMPASPPSTEWLEASTNALIKRKAHLAAKLSFGAAMKGPDGNEDEADGDGGCDADGRGENIESRRQREVQADEVRYSVPVGGTSLTFTPAERAKIVEVAAGGASPGLSIVCFKRYEDIIQHKHIVKRCSFVHANLRQGGAAALRLFVLLARTLRRQGKVAIAQYLMRKGSAPRLVALVPSPPSSSLISSTTASALPATIIAPETSLPADGLGFYMVPLPYADDIRSVPVLAETTIAVKGATALPEPGSSEANVSASDVALAKSLVNSLTVPYDIAAVPNPSLQIVYQSLQDLALRRIAMEQDENEEGGLGKEEQRQQSELTVKRERAVDWTLPDEEGMARYRDLFHQFNTLVLQKDYDADALCPQPRSTTGASAAQRRPRANTTEDTEDGGAVPLSQKRCVGDVKSEDGVETLVDVVRDAAERNAWHKLTVAQLREYLKMAKASGGGAKKKDELIEAAKTAFVKVKKEK